MRVINSLVLGACILGGFYLHNRFVTADKLISTISVNGKAEEAIKADMFDWKFIYSSVGDTPQAAKEAVKIAKKEICAILEESGLIRDEDYAIKPRELNHKKTDDGKDVFTMSQTYEVKTQKMEAAEAAYKASETLSDKGITISSGNDSRYTPGVYNIKDKRDLEKKLLDRAMRDAREKAEQVASLAGGTIIGMPELGYSYVRTRDANAAEDAYQWGGGSTIDQIATLEVSTTFKMRP
ncbi:MAG: SIMPL domain-containing protein [Holosporales bacterium]|jgi:hypothetical protein|nr:SIMPL domain-containing protein [Holosporales bacterium]